MNNRKTNRTILVKAMLVIQALLFNLNAQNLILNGSFENNLCITYTNTCSNHKYDSLMSNSHSFGTQANLDIMTSADSYCGSSGAANDGNWFLGVTSYGADAFSLSLSSTLMQGEIYTLIFYDRQSDIDTAGSAVQIGVSSTDSTMGTIIYTAPSPKTCQWTKRTISFLAPASVKYVTVTCPYNPPASSYWTHVDNFILDTGSTMGIEQVKTNDIKVSIYPNPTQDKIYVEAKQEVEIKLTDILGKEVLSAKGQEADVSNITNGIYFVQIKTSEGILTKKVVIQH